MKQGYTVALTVHVNPDGDLGLFQNGLKQNVLFLAMLFRNAPNCKRVVLLNQGPMGPVIPPWLPWVPEISRPTPELVREIDYLIGIGSAVERSLVEAVHANGGKVIAYKGGNDAVMGMEAVAGRPEPMPGSTCYYDYDCFDAVWLTPQHTHSNKTWCEIVYRCPVEEVPQVWSPVHLEATKPAEFGYQTGKRPWRIGIMDPNNTSMKTSHWPMLVCEAAWRENREAIKHIYVTNAIHLKEFEAFKTFAKTLDTVNTQVATFEGRFPTSPFLAANCDAVVTHQWENELNYLYYDVLWGGYPLIHNSGALIDHGYYYPTFDAHAGAKALLRARRHHDKALPALRAKDAELFERLSPSNPGLIGAHERLLARLDPL